MQKQSKIIALAGMLAVIAGIVVATTIEQAEAQNKPENPNPRVPNSFGRDTAGIVCGNRLCDVVSNFNVEDNTPIEEISNDSSDAPTAKLISVHKYKSAPFAGEVGISYKITFRVTAGDTNLKDIQIHGQSDIDTIDHTITSLSSYKSSVQVVRIHAIDPDSITGKIVSYTLPGPTSGP
jgi:hypothetical protein